jgi:hypothetical protein
MMEKPIKDIEFGSAIVFLWQISLLILEARLGTSGGVSIIKGQTIKGY